MSLPNLLTILRITIAPIIAILIWRETSYAQLIAAFVLFLFAGITDWLDGYLARKLLLQSHLGRILDPIADKVLVACILLALSSHYSKDWMFVVPTLAIFLREFIISGFREYMSNEGILVQVSVGLPFMEGHAEAKNAVALAVMILILLFRPQGIFGQKERIS